MPLPTADPQYYRPAAGIAILDANGRVWIGRRKGQLGKYVWQLPQGGIDRGETAQDAALRELYEETGIRADQVVILGRIEDELFYDFPKGYRQGRFKKSWRGQRQSWFAMRFLGRDQDVDLKAHPPQEFSKWRWAELSELPDLIIPFKRKVYERMVNEFDGFAKADKAPTRE